MARRKAQRRIKYKTVAKKAKRYASRSAKGTALFQPDSMLYGAGRRYLSQLVKPITDKFGVAGNLADNAVIGTGLWFLAKKSKGFVRQVAIKGLVGENILAGDDIASQVLNKTASSGNNSAW